MTSMVVLGVGKVRMHKSMEVPELCGCFTCGVVIYLGSAEAEWTGIKHWSYLFDLWVNDAEIKAGYLFQLKESVMV